MVLIKEFRIVMPFDVDEYKKGLLSNLRIFHLFFFTTCL